MKGKLRISVNFIIEEVYEYDFDDDTQDEDEMVQQAKEELLSDFDLEEWQGEWATSYVNYDGMEG